MKQMGVRRHILMAVCLAKLSIAGAAENNRTFASAMAAPVDKPMRFSGKIEGKAETWSFPYLVDPDNEQAVAKINEYMHIAEMRWAPPAKPPASVQPVEGEDEMPRELISEGVKVLNEGRVIEVGYWHLEKGIAYGEHRKIQFDARNGATVWPEDILTPAGIKALAARTAKARAANLDKEERKLEAEAAKKKKGSSRADIDETIAIFDFWRRTCYEDKNAVSWSSPGIVRMVENGLHVEAISCGGGSLDMIAPFELTLNAKEAMPYLTPYGKYLIGGQGDGAQPFTRPLGRILHGTINGNLGVTMYLDRYETNEHFSGYYYYDKHRQLIPLAGQLKGKGAVELKEGEASQARRPEFHLQLKAGRLVGKWLDGKKSFDVELKP